MVKRKYKATDNFGKEIKRLREQKNMTQISLAKKLFVNASSIQNWENGRSFPADATCDHIISLFKLSKEEQDLLFIKTNNYSADITENASAEEEKIPNKKTSGEVAISENVCEEHENCAEEPEVCVEKVEVVTGEREVCEEALSEKAANEVVSTMPTNEAARKQRKPLPPLLKIFIISAIVWLAAWGVIFFIVFIAFNQPISEEFRAHTLAAYMRVSIIDWPEFIAAFIISFVLITGIPVLVYKIIKKVKKTK